MGQREIQLAALRRAPGRLNMSEMISTGHFQLAADSELFVHYPWSVVKRALFALYIIILVT
jgi:hypothetical protein